MDWAIVLDAFCSACENESSKTSVSLPGVKRRQRVVADRDRIRRSFIKPGYRLIVQRDGKRVRRIVLLVVSDAAAQFADPGNEAHLRCRLRVGAWP